MIKYEILQSETIEENARQMFKVFDEDSDGFITLAEYTKVANTFGENVDKQMEALFKKNESKQIDINGKWSII